VIDELRTAADIASWLAVGLALRRIAPREPAAGPDARAGGVDGADDDATVAGAIAACANELPALPPPGVIADIATLLTGARAPIAAGATTAADEALRTAIRAYDDDVLVRLTGGAGFDDVLAAYAHAAAADRTAAVALVVAAVCERAGFAGVSVSPAALRRALARPRDERAAAGRDGLHGGPTARRLADAYHRLARGARQCRALVDDREVFAVDHLAVLRDLGSRMTAAHIGASAAAIARRLPRRLPVSRELRGQRDTRLADDTLYPAGGFASITAGGATTGNIENLVTSELVYMEDDEPIDLFSLRYVEGELLHYTRDDSVFRRHRHLIAIVLGADLDDARVKDRDLPWQRLILALGLVVAAIRWLADQLGDQALTVHVGFPPQLLAEERQIVALLLEGEIARGTVVIVEQPWRETIELAVDAGGTAIADVVVVSLGDPPELPIGLRALHVHLAGAAPVVTELAPRPGPHPEAGAEPWSAWCEGAEDLLRWLV
jgi:vWA domain found in the FtsH ternary systems/N-terminal helical region fused to the FtsH ternary system vWA domain